MMGESDRKPVTIERRNIPLRQVLEEEIVREELLGRGIALSGPDAALARLAHSSGTFEQYLRLAGEKRLPQAQLTALGEALEAADRSAPVLLEEQYPWLKNSRWTLRMRDVSYYKVALEYAPGEFLNLDRIECGKDSARETPDTAADGRCAGGMEKTVKKAAKKTCGTSLYLYPDSASTSEPIRLKFQDYSAVLSFMKRLLLCGEIRWESYEPLLRAMQ